MSFLGARVNRLLGFSEPFNVEATSESSKEGLAVESRVGLVSWLGAFGAGFPECDDVTIPLCCRSWSID